MTSGFEFATAGRIIFNEGAVQQVPAIAASFGPRTLLVTGRSRARAADLESDLKAAGVEPVPFSIEGEPSLDVVRQGAATAWDWEVDSVISFGGGSTIDAGKAIAALLTNPGDLLEYLEVIGEGQPIAVPPAPFIAIPTTAGTGSEVTRNSVLYSPDHKAKASMRSQHLLPRVAVVDPELTYSVPAPVTAATGMDALTQLIEPYVSPRANSISDMFCLEGMQRVAGSLLRAFKEGHDREARHDMAMASMLGGLALANSGLGAVHGLANPLGGMFLAPHGAICGVLLPHVMAVNIRMLRASDPRHPALMRYSTVARILTGSAEVSAEDGAAWASELSHSMNIQPLRYYGIREDDLPAIVEKGMRASSMKANPVPLTEKELTEILSRAL